LECNNGSSFRFTKNEAKEFSPVETDVVQRVILHDISWETYEKILAEHNEVSNPHFAYCDGKLEIAGLGYKHEKTKKFIIRTRR
jgi:Uma2 family endonuclease